MTGRAIILEYSRRSDDGSTSTRQVSLGASTSLCDAMASMRRALADSCDGRVTIFERGREFNLIGDVVGVLARP